MWTGGRGAGPGRTRSQRELPHVQQGTRTVTGDSEPEVGVRSEERRPIQVGGAGGVLTGPGRGRQRLSCSAWHPHMDAHFCDAA